MTTVTMTTNGKTANPEYPHTLNVLFHGLWAYEVATNEIIVRTPPDENHRVAAGSWIPEAGLRQDATYRLEGIAAGSCSTFDEVTNAVFSDREFVTEADVYCTIRLPLPDNISSLRPINFHRDKPPYTGADAHLVTTRQIAIVQVFTYSAKLERVRLVELEPGVPDAPPIRLPMPGGNAQVANFYLFAQPDGRVNGSHFEEAFAKLAALYGLDIVPVPSVAPGPRSPEVAGVTWRDLVGLNERAMFRKELVPAAGTSGSNCDPFIVDNRKTPQSHASQSKVQPAAYPTQASGR